MKRSRLRMFKATSMTISIMGVLMIVATVAILAYLGFQSISSLISTDASSSNANEQLAALQSEYSSLKAQYDTVKAKVQNSGNNQLKQDYNTAELELIKAQSAITDVSSAISVGKPSDEVNERIKTAQAQIQVAKTSLSGIKSRVG
ncbi:MULTISPECIES: hypothetical protein [Methanobacterium]|uniref:Uncharacterized protein n=2 Tax=Methanobacterium formicicum TaxID=2162 RepID=A0A843AKP6_METFO|nr:MULTISPECIES: hypothetical protein [Methanobacterium]MBF4475429.1 hypothetical protein [Methanobacterium formicicum]MDD4809859.1 hypothetical protein [Methanobacterium formicicum]MDG3547628.1 hypothetical protein [Methanobacterium formicicum]MDH2658886.1 hypothetical protein [Methanobacterium formicicum]